MEKQGTGKKIPFSRKVWPILITSGPHPLSWVGNFLAVNIIIVSSIFWPELPFQGQKISMIWSINLLITGVSRLFYGLIVDRYSRKKIMTIHHILQGIVFFSMGCIPQGQGDLSYYLFLFLIAIYSFLNGGASAGGDVPVTCSYIDDFVEENERSRIFGLIAMIQQFVAIFGTITAAILFQNYWRQYFFIVGIIIATTGIIVGLKAPEPKRGAKKQELWKILQVDSIMYKYQLTKETFKSTILSKTNILTIAEGIFTQIVIAIPNFLIYAFFESEPYNLSPLSLSLFSIIFGIPGALIGTVFLAKKIDKMGQKNIKNRIYTITISQVISYSMWVFIVLMPLVPLTSTQGANIGIILSFPVYWAVGLFLFIVSIVNNLYIINQRPIVQKINLPEAQGLITGLNIFVENIGRGIGLFLSGILFVIFTGNYISIFLIMFFLGFVGAGMWMVTTRTIEPDVARISNILQSRAKELEDNSKSH